MNYLKNLNHTYQRVTGFTNPIIFYNDNSIYRVSPSDLTEHTNLYTTGSTGYFKDILDFANEETNHNAGQVSMFYIPSPNTAQNYQYGYFFFSQFIDYVVFNLPSATGNTYYGSNLGMLYTEVTETLDLDSAFSTQPNYLQVDTYQSLNDTTNLTYAPYEQGFGGFDKSIIFDNTFVYEYDTPNSGNLFQVQLYKEALFRTTALRIGYNQLTTFSLDISYSDIASNEYQDRYNKAFEAGKTEGLSQGYGRGFNEGVAVGEGMDKNVASGFTYIGQSFNAISTILSIEILPQVTLGLVASVPFILAIIGLILKLIKK